MNARLSRPILLLVIPALFPALVPLLANNIQVTNVTVEKSNNDTWHVQFNLSWENSWKNDYSRDAAWIFVKYRKIGTATWHHAFLDASGHSTGSCANACNIEPGLREPLGNANPNPVVGAYFYRDIGQSNYANELLSSTQVKLKWNFAENTEKPLNYADQVEVRVYALEMVHVEQGAFHAGRADAANTIRESNGGGPFPVTDTLNASSIRFGDPVMQNKVIGAHGADKVGIKGTSISLPHTVPSDVTDRILLVGIAVNDNNDKSSPIVNSAKYGSTNLVLQGTMQENDKMRSWVYRLDNPPAGTQNVSITLSATGKGAVVGAVTFSNVDLTQVGSPVFKSMTGTTHTSDPMDTEPGDVIFDAISIENTAITQGQSQTQNWSVSANSTGGGSSYQVATGNSTTMSWSSGTNSKKSVLTTIRLRPTQEYNNDGVLVDGDGGISWLENGVPTDENPDFPTGYMPFYCMKYEVTQAQYAAFLNTLTLEQQEARTVCGPYAAVGAGALSSTNSYRNGIQLQVPSDPYPARFGCNLNDDNTFNDPETDGLPIACNYLSWDDLAAWLDWAALRPMTDLEYEKTGRISDTDGCKYPWGGTAPTLGPQMTISNPGSVSEQLDVSDQANVNAGGSISGPARIGIYARASGQGYGNKQTRFFAGASHCGIMDIAGNLWEMVVSLDSQEGRAFTGSHGDGKLSSNGDHEWLDLAPAAGIGVRGGAWNTTDPTKLQVSDRSHMSDNTPSSRHEAYGGRGVRSANN